MRRTLAVLAAVIVAFGTVAAIERPLTAEEEAAITTYLTQRNAHVVGTPREVDYRKQRRLPYALCREYEKKAKMTNYPWHPGLGTQRYTSRPKFPGWDDAANYTWYPDGPNYQRQLKCKKCGGWCNPSGSDCERKHPLPPMDQWRFTARLIATDHKKPMEAKAHVWNAHEHDEITDAQYDELMGIIDTIEAEAEAKGQDAVNTP